MSKFRLSLVYDRHCAHLLIKGQSSGLNSPVGPLPNPRKNGLSSNRQIGNVVTCSVFVELLRGSLTEKNAGTI